MTHPGIGTLTGLALVHTLGPVERFATARKVTAYVGLDPLEHSSGERQRIGSISKQGSKLLRYLMVEAGHNDTFPQGSGSRQVALTADAGCAWDAVSSDASWLSASPAHDVGSKIINYSVTANSGQQRVGSISIKVGGQTFATLTVTQAPNQASGNFALNPSSRLVGVGGMLGLSFNVTTGAGCLWNANTTDGWITISGGATNPLGGGSGPVSFNVQANNGGSRTGSISVGGYVFTITQCGYLISPTTASFGSGIGSGSFTVSAAAGCSWSATSNNADWIAITGGATAPAVGL
jgi:hypothetical protein